MLVRCVVKNKSRCHVGRRLTECWEYPRGESNSYLKFRKLLFYPLNYRGCILRGKGTTFSLKPKKRGIYGCFFLANSNCLHSFAWFSRAYLFKFI